MPRFLPSDGTPTTAPDIELTARVTARAVTIEQEGPIRVELRAEPGPTDSRTVRSQPAGARSYRNLTIDARLAAWLTDPAAAPPEQSTESTGEPQ